MKASKLAAGALVLLGFGGAAGLTAGNTAAAQSPGVTRHPAEAQTDPAGPSAGSYRVNRGGGWHRNALYCRSAVRGSIAPRFRDDRLGFRLVCLP